MSIYIMGFSPKNILHTFSIKSSGSNPLEELSGEEERKEFASRLEIALDIPSSTKLNFSTPSRVHLSRPSRHKPRYEEKVSLLLHVDFPKNIYCETQQLSLISFLRISLLYRSFFIMLNMFILF